MVAQIRRQLPDITPTRARNTESISDEAERLAAYVPDLAARAIEYSQMP